MIKCGIDEAMVFMDMRTRSVAKVKVKSALNLDNDTVRNLV